MIHLNLYRGAPFLFLTLSLLMGSSVKPLYAQETEACIDFNTPYKRIGYGFDSQSYGNAEQKAIKNMRHIATKVYPESCGGEPVVLCKENSRQDTIKGLNVYRARVRFACPSDEGITVENQENDPFIDKHSFYASNNYDSTLYLKNKNHDYHLVNRLDQKTAFHKYFKKACGQEYSKKKVDPNLIYDVKEERRRPALLVHADWSISLTYKIRLKCTPPPKITVDHEAIGKNKGNPDPRKNWRYEKWWSGESFDAAKRKCDTKVAEKNLCRFRGGAVDITYKETRSEHYWVSLRYRCRYD